MRFTDIFVRRPILALVVSSLIVLLGVFALNKLPIRQYPGLETSTITIATAYPGASAELMQGFVTQPIAQAVSTVEGLDYIASSSSAGMSLVTLRMELNRDSTKALAEATAKVGAVRYRLPERAYDPVVELSAGDSTAVAYVGFYGEGLSIPQLTDYLSRAVEPQFAAIEGVAKVEVGGGQRLAMRLWLDAERMAGHGLTASDVAGAVRQNNYQASPGQVRGQSVLANVRVNTDLNSVEGFRDLVIRSEGANLVRVRDIGTVELGAASTQTSAHLNGEPAVYLSIFPTPKGNPLIIVDGIKQLLPTIEQNLPPGIKVVINYERARFIQASIDEVMKTLLEAVLIVILVIWLALGSLRSVVIAVVAIPLSMLGAAALMALFGMSINLLTLLALVLAIGLVVDDAIVVVENVHRHIEAGKSPVAAALIGAREIFAAVIAMDLTLAAVYVPIGLMGGLTGALFREFALTLAGAVMVSGVVALTLSPVMASFLLKSGLGGHGRMEQAAERFFGALATRYGRLLHASLRQRWLTGGFALIVCISLPILYPLPQRELAPPEDQAAILMAIKSPQHVNLDYAEQVGAQWNALMQQVPESLMSWIINGTGSPANSFAGINLSDWGERERSEGEIVAQLQHTVAAIEGSSIFVFQVPPLPGGSGGLPVQLVLRTAQGYPQLYEAMEALKREARASGLFAVVDSDLDYNSPVVQVNIDRNKAASLGIGMQAIGDSLSVLLDEGYINRFTLFDRSYDVITQSTREQRLTPEALARQFVRSADGTLVPLSTLVTLDMQVEPNSLNQFNQQNAAILQAVPNVSMGEAVAFLEQAVSALPAGFSHDWQAESRQYVQEGNALVFAFLAALVVIYLVLTAQYESLIDPLNRPVIDLRRTAAAGVWPGDPQHLHPDRPCHLDRAYQQTRHLDGGLCQHHAGQRQP